MIAAIPWAMPSIAPATPATSGAILTARTTIPATASTYAAAGKKYSGVALAYKLEGADINMDGLTLQDIEGQSANIVFRSYGAGEVRNLRIERMRMTSGIYTSGIPSGLIYSGGTRLIDAVFRDLTYKSIKPVTNPSDIVAAFALTGKDADDTGDGILLESFDFRDLIATYTTGYKNTDGVSVEGGYLNFTAKNGIVSNVSDACYDIKPPKARLDNCFGEKSREIFKLWQPNHHGALYSANPSFAHLLLAGDDGTHWTDPLVIDHLSCRNAAGTQPIFRTEGGTRPIIVKSHDLSGCKPGTPLISKDGPSAASSITWVQGMPGNGATL